MSFTRVMRRRWTYTTSSSVYSRIPLRGPSAASLMVALISSYEAPFSSLTTKSTTETSGVGTRKAIPVNFPLRLGMTLPTALAAPVEEGMMLAPAPRPPRPGRSRKGKGNKSSANKLQFPDRKQDAQTHSPC